jgi:hypothetical protein
MHHFMEVGVLFEPKVDLERLTKVLDELGHEGRVHTIRTWDSAKQAKLWDAARGFRKITVDAFVPQGTAAMTGVLHEGKNSLPMFSHFRKHFCRPEGDDGVIWGYNQNWYAPFSGHGYFVAKNAEAEGEVDFDYRILPKAKPDAWPPLLDNHARLGRFIWVGMVDHLRGISRHITIGRAERGGKLADVYFVLCRQDPA